ncbi:MAG: LCP family protein [Ruminococcus sp.]|nr:LCP family protein [Ruminococcus sp.]
MSEKYRNGRPVHKQNDDQNTRTTMIPPEARQQYREKYQQQPQNYQQPYQEQPQQQYYQQPYQGQPQQQYYQQPYQGQPQQQNYQQPYQEQPQQQYYQQPYQGQPQQQYYQQPYQEQPQQQYYQQQYQEQPQGQYHQQPQPVNRPERATAPKKRRQAPAPAPQQKPKKKRKKGGISAFFRRLITTLLILLLLLFGMYSCTSLSLIKKLNYVPTGNRERTSGAIDRSYVTSVLLIGTDGRSLDERGRSDTMMLVSINSSTKKIHVTSFMRDSYVEIPGYGWDKLNASYSYGGAELLMDTIEHNFGVKIDDYVSINFLSFASIVDSVGGIDVDLSDAEAGEINVILQAEVNQIMGDNVTDDLLSGGGKNVHLIGKQALAYARIRHIGNADFERTERQRRVVDLVMNKMKSFSPIMMKNLASNVLPDVSTNMETSELYLLSLRAPMLLSYERVPLQIPVDGSYYGESTPSGDALIVDLDSNYNVLRDTVFSRE